MTGDAKKVIARGALLDSFWLFLLYGFGAKFWCAAKSDDNWLDPAVHKRMADYFERHVKEWEEWRRRGVRKAKKIAFFVPRGYAKSTEITEAGSLWVALRNPDLVEVISSYGIEKSRDFLGVIKTVMEGRAAYGWWKDLYGSWEPYDSRQWTIESITHGRRTAVETRDPSVEVTSISKGATGSRPDAFFYDDPTSEDKIAKEEDHVRKGVAHFRSMRYAIKSNGLWVVCATRYRDYDVPGVILSEQGVAEFAPTGCRPRKDDYKEGGEWNVYFLAARDAEGASTLPGVYPPEVLDEMEKDDPVTFAAQMMNAPSEGRHSLITDEDVHKLWVLPEEIQGRDLRITIHLDTAFKTLERVESGDDNVIGVVGHSRSGDGLLYFLEARVSNSWNSEEFFDELVALLQRLKRERKWPYAITDERETGGKEGLFTQVLQSRCAAVGLPAPRLITISRAGTKKEVRVRLAADYWRQGVVRLVRGSPGIEKLAKQMVKYHYAPHDDVADAFADAFHEEVYFPERVMAHIDEGGVVARRPLDDRLYGGRTLGEYRRRTRDEIREEQVEEPWYRNEGRPTW